MSKRTGVPGLTDGDTVSGGPERNQDPRDGEYITSGPAWEGRKAWNRGTLMQQRRMAKEAGCSLWTMLLVSIFEVLNGVRAQYQNMARATYKAMEQQRADFERIQGYMDKADKLMDRDLDDDEWKADA